MSNQTTAQKLRAMMQARGMSQHELARRSGLSQANISKYYNARQEPSDETLEKIAKSLNCKQDAIRGSKSRSYMRISVPVAITRLLDEPGIEVRLEKGQYVMAFDSSHPLLHDFLKNVARARRFYVTEAMDEAMYKDLIDGLTMRYEMATKPKEAE